MVPHMSAPLSTQVRRIFRNALDKASYSFRITYKCSESDREQKIALYKTGQQQKQHTRARAHTRTPAQGLLTSTTKDKAVVKTGTDWSVGASYIGTKPTDLGKNMTAPGRG